MLSIIIPTLNEEKYLPKMLDSVKKQDFSDYEIIIADAGSTDKTKEIAESYGCRIISGGLPARGRNEGAKAAKGDLLLFSDADNLLKPGFLKKNIEEMERKNIKIAATLIEPFEGPKITKWFFNIFYNSIVILTEKFLAHTAIAIFVYKDIFEKVNGFDEEIILAEDHDMGRKAAKISKYGVLKSVKILTSERRFRKDGWLKTYLKYIYTEFHMIFKGPVKKGGIIEYEFNHYSKKDKR